MPVSAIETGDFNQDGKADYLVAIDFPEQGWIDQSIWSFIQTPSGTVASRLESSNFADGEKIPPVSLAWKNYQLGDIPFPFSVVQAGSDLIAFRVEADGTAQVLFKDLRARSYAPLGEGFSVVNVDWNGNTQVSTYTWDPAGEKFREQLAGYDFARVEQTVEQLLFVEQNYPAAIAHIERFLIEAPSEQNHIVNRSQDSVTYSTDWYRPYLLYLLGIAYEMDGKPGLAVETYLLLWQSYPENIFGRAAMDKLVLRQP